MGIEVDVVDVDDDDVVVDCSTSTAVVVVIGSSELPLQAAEVRTTHSTKVMGRITPA